MENKIKYCIYHNSDETDTIEAWYPEVILKISLFLQVMLVVICAIRKAMECVFKNEELKLLDDLLPSKEESFARGSSRSQHQLSSQSSVSCNQNGTDHVTVVQMDGTMPVETMTKGFGYKVTTFSQSSLKRRLSKALNVEPLAPQMFSLELDDLYKILNHNMIAETNSRSKRHTGHIRAFK